MKTIEDLKTSAVGAGMILEALVFAIALSLLVLSTPPGVPLVLSFVIAQGVMLYSIHCLSHYIVGRLVGIRFTKIVVGRSALRKSNSRVIRLIGRNAVTPVLIIDRSSLKRASPLGRKAMFYSGVTASTTVPFLVALYAVWTGDLISVGVTVLFSLGYLVFNFFYSPKTGDIYRARLLGAIPSQGS